GRSFARSGRARRAPPLRKNERKYEETVDGDRTPDPFPPHTGEGWGEERARRRLAAVPRGPPYRRLPDRGGKRRLRQARVVLHQSASGRGGGGRPAAGRDPARWGGRDAT